MIITLLLLVFRIIKIECICAYMCSDIFHGYFFI
nr:MAG TPA: hypothetical protein [Caudoviricetes sp.]